MRSFRKLLLPVAMGAAIFSAPAARAQTTEAKPAEAKPAATVAERVDLLEVKQNDAVVKGDIPGSFRIPGSEISLRVYGFAEVDWVHSFNNDNTDSDYSTFAPYLPLEDSDQAERGGRDYLTARVSRVGLEAGMPTKYGVMAMKIEGDFNNEPRSGGSALYGSPGNVYTQSVSNSYGFRLRHAYGAFGGLLAGQTWSTFMDVDNFPETVDYNGPVGATFIRQPQIRYAYATSKAGTFTAAVENSVSYVLDVSDPTSPVAIAASASRMPDVVVRWDKGFGFGALSLRAMTQELRIKEGDLDASKRGYGVAASGLIKTRGRDFLTWGVTYGTGIGRYLNYVEGAAYDPAEEEIVLETALGGYLGYQVKASDLLRFNFAGGFTYEFDSDYTDLAEAVGFDAGRFGVNRWVYQGHAGFFVSPVPATDFGLEAIYSGRQTLADEKGQELRLNLMARYYIN